MLITTMGLVLIPIGIILFLSKYKFLLYLTVFFSGFTGSSVINFRGFSLQPSYMFFILFFIRYIIKVINRGSLTKPNKIITLFILICSISLAMPIILENKDIIVLNPDNYYESVRFSIQNITQYIYIVFAFIVYLICKDFLKYNQQMIPKFINIFLFSALTICVLGIYQEIAYIFNLPFDEIFRQGIHGSIQPYGSFIRVSGVAQEPSMYAVFIVMALAIVLYVPKSIFKYKNILITLLIINGILSTSSTFFIGFIFILFMIFLSIFKMQHYKSDLYNLSYLVIIGVTLISIMLVLFNINPQIKNIIIDGTISKLQGEGKSAIDRSTAFYHHMNVALNYPLLGVGFGSVRSYDLFSTWLSSIGFIGMNIFVLFIGNLVYKCNIKKDTQYKNLLKGYSISIISVVILLFISVPEPYYLFIWINISIVENILDIKLNSIDNYN